MTTAWQRAGLLMTLSNHRATKRKKYATKNCNSYPDAVNLFHFTGTIQL